jgi:pyruvate dehydrogenase E2 component (dihydrolipoamide acetyltransferase)
VGEAREFRLPDVGDFEHVDVVEVLVQVGDRVEKEQGLVVLESDKATMELPAPFAGVVRALEVAVGDQVSEGDLIALIEPEAAAAPEEPAAPRPEPEGGAVADAAPAAAAEAAAGEEAVGTERDAPAAARRAPPERGAAAAPEGRASPERGPLPHASPSVRRLARELGVELAHVSGSGRKGRITKDDVQGFVRASLQGSGRARGAAAAAPLDVDFAEFGPVEREPLPRFRRVAAANLERSWTTVPHVTQFDEADVTDLEAFRKEQRAEADARGVKLTFLPFVIRACVAALREYPHFNASLDPSGETLVVKRYYHVGVAVDTEHGLVVPVLHDADRKGLFDLAEELQTLSEKARARRLAPAEIRGGSFSISSLGGIGGTFFTPIVNHPEVAILGVSRMEWRPIWRDGAFVPRLVLPLSLSYDHRVIDGADAVRFTRHVAGGLSDLRRLLL